MAKIRYSDEFICPKCGSHTALVCRTDGTHQAHCMICDVYYDVEVAKATNADQIRAMTDRAMTDEELARWIATTADDNCPDTAHERYCDNRCGECWLDWLKSPVEVDNG